MKALIKWVVLLAFVSCAHESAISKITIEVDHDEIEPGGLRVCRPLPDNAGLECISLQHYVEIITQGQQ